MGDLLQGIEKVNENFAVNMYSNGFMVEVNGRDNENDWKTIKIVVNSVSELLKLIEDIASMERDN